MHLFAYFNLVARCTVAESSISVHWHGACHTDAIFCGSDVKPSRAFRKCKRVWPHILRVSPRPWLEKLDSCNSISTHPGRGEMMDHQAKCCEEETTRTKHRAKILQGESSAQSIQSRHTQEKVSTKTSSHSLTEKLLVWNADDQPV